MKMMLNSYWIWILGEEKPNYNITGKYLFFSPNKDNLIEITINEIEKHLFHRAKVNKHLLRGQTEHVLCARIKPVHTEYCSRVCKDKVLPIVEFLIVHTTLCEVDAYKIPSIWNIHQLLELKWHTRTHQDTLRWFNQACA